MTSTLCLDPPSSSCIVHLNDGSKKLCTLELKEYRPSIFAILRERAGFTEADYLQSLSYENLNTISADSKSGQNFWVSSNGRVVLKTIKGYEARNMLQILDSYALHAMTGRSAIAAVLGLYRIKMDSGKRVYFLACANIYPIEGVTQKFDLKGSLVGRKASRVSTVAKDLDLLESGGMLDFGSSRQLVLHTLRRDTEFLKRHMLMDYSLLVAVQRVSNSAEDIGSGSDDAGQKRVGASFSGYGDAGCLRIPGGQEGCVFHLGIIDILQRYTFRKFCETEVKGFYQKSEISCVDPGLYAKRFIEFISNFSL